MGIKINTNTNLHVGPLLKEITLSISAQIGAIHLIAIHAIAQLFINGHALCFSVSHTSYARFIASRFIQLSNSDLIWGKASLATEMITADTFKGGSHAAYYFSSREVIINIIHKAKTIFIVHSVKIFLAAEMMLKWHNIKREPYLHHLAAREIYNSILRGRRLFLHHLAAREIYNSSSNLAKAGTILRGRRLFLHHLAAWEIYNSKHNL